MLYCDKIDISRGIYHSKSNESNECKICHYRFFNHGFKFQDSVCSGCHDLIMLSVNINDIVIVTVKKIDYRCIIHSISKSWKLWVYIKNIALIFILFKAVFCFAIYKMVDSEYITGKYKSSKISIGKVMKNPLMLKILSWSPWN